MNPKPSRSTENTASRGGEKPEEGPAPRHVERRRERGLLPLFVLFLLECAEHESVSTTASVLYKGGFDIEGGGRRV